MVKLSYSRNQLESNNVVGATIAVTDAAELPTHHRLADIEQIDARHLLEMENTICQLVHKNQKIKH